MLLLVPAFIQTAPPEPRELPGPWERLLEQHRASQQPWPRWRLLARVPVQPTDLRTGPLLRLIASGELELMPVSGKEAASLWAQREWGQDLDWALLSPVGTVTVTGRGAPVPAALEAPIEGGGWPSRAQRFQEFVKAKDGTGEAYGQALMDAARLLAFTDDLLKTEAGKPLPWWVWEAPPPDPVLLGLKAASGQELVRALDGLHRHQGYELWPDLAAALGLMPITPDTASRDALRPLLADLVAQLQRHPQSAALWAAWSQVARRLPNEVSEYTPSLFAVPQGDPWPPPAGLRAVLPLLEARGDHRVVLAYCRNQLLAPVPLGLHAETAWRRDRLQRIQDWGLPGLEALVRLKAESDGALWLGELRRLWGKDWPTSRLQTFLRRVDPDWLPDSWNQAILEEALEDPPLPEEAEPPPTPSLALDAGRDGLLERGWRALHESPALDAWGPADLRWTSFTVEGLRRIREDFGLDSRPRWFLLQGRNLIASGTTAPEPAYIQERLRGLRAPRLEVLNAFLARNPQQLEARADRFQLLRNRLPQPRLEQDLLADAEAALLPVAAEGNWAPSGKVWTAAAQRVLPRLEEHLRHWPSDLGAWRSWVAWSEVHPLKPKALNLAATVEAWPVLPPEAARLIATQLVNRGEWKALQTFAQAQWDGLVAQARPIHPTLPQLDERQLAELDFWLSALEDALSAQDQGPAIRALKLKFTELSLRKAPAR